MVMTCCLGGPQSALAGDELIAITDLPHDQRLQDSVRANAVRERRQLLVIEHLSRLEGIVIDLLHCHLSPRVLTTGTARFGQEGIQTAPKPTFFHHCSFSPNSWQG